MAYVAPPDFEFEVDDPFPERMPLNWPMLIGITLCFAFWAAVIATAAVFV